MVNNLPLDHVSVLKEMMAIMNMIKMWPLISFLFWMLWEESSSECKILLFYEACWLSRGKILHMFLKQKMRSQDTDTMPIKTILALRDFLKWGISVIGSLTRRIWIDPFRVKVAQCFIWRLRYRDFLKIN